jgi:hypothetical protein
MADLLFGASQSLTRHSKAVTTTNGSAQHIHFRGLAQRVYLSADLASQ